MQRVAAHDPGAQRELVERYVARVRRRCQLLLRDGTEADDATQVALLETLRSAKGFGPPGNLDAWVDRITARTAVRQRQRAAARRSVLARLAEAMHLPQWLDTRESPLLTGQMEEYLGRLPEERREAFVLRHALGYSVDEVAELTEAPRGTVKGRLVSARKQLRKMIESDFREMRSSGDDR